MEGSREGTLGSEIAVSGEESSRVGTSPGKLEEGITHSTPGQLGGNEDPSGLVLGAWTKMGKGTRSFQAQMEVIQKSFLQLGEERKSFMKHKATQSARGRTGKGTGVLRPGETTVSKGG